MDDETLTPFVDALSASLVIMVLVSICFTLQNIISIRDSAKQVVDIKSEENGNNSPVIFRPALEFNLEDRYINYYINFKLTQENISKLKSQLEGAKQLKITIKSKQSQNKSTSNLINFITLLELPPELKVTTSIEKSDLYYSKLEWEFK